ncbi:MAG TPA: hydroxyisourate hydrolase, partial [Candidatus Limnocylindrales bacterium]
MANRAPTISSHVLDTSRGAPAAGVRIDLSRVGVDGVETAVGSALTDADGRVADLLGTPLSVGTYRLRFSVGERSPLFASLAVDVRVDDVGRSYHVPLLL